MTSKGLLNLQGEKGGLLTSNRLTLKKYLHFVQRVLIIHVAGKSGILFLYRKKLLKFERDVSTEPTRTCTVVFS